MGGMGGRLNANQLKCDAGPGSTLDSGTPRLNAGSKTILTLHLLLGLLTILGHLSRMPLHP